MRSISAIVSLPEKCVQRSASSSRSASPASKRVMVTSVARFCRQARIESVVPATWKNGREEWNRSAVRSPMRCPETNPLPSMLRWVSITPFGKAVVPEVNWINSVSSASAAGPGSSAAALIKSDHERHPSGMLLPRTMISPSSGRA